MAKARTRATRTTTTTTARTARTKSKRPAGATEVEIVEEEEGGNIDTGIVAITTVLLVAAILMMDKVAAMYGKGILMG